MATRTFLIAVLLPVALLAAGLVIRSEWIADEMARRHPPAGSFIALPNGRLHYREIAPESAGAGTVVLLHGASSTHADLLATLGPELRRYRVLAIDRPGHGWSDRLEGAAMADPARQAAVLLSALDRLSPEPFVLVAHSLAGAAAARIALDRPERLRGLVLLGGVTHPWPGGIDWYHHPASWPVVGPLFTRLLALPAASFLLEPGAKSVFAPNPPTPNYLDTSEVRLLLRPGSFQANSQDIAATHAFVTAQASRYRTLQAPVIAITGDSDAIVSATIHSAAIAREAPRGRFVLLPGVGHMPHHAAPEIVVGAIDELMGPRSGLARR